RDTAIQTLQSTGADASPTYLLPDVRRLLEMFPDFSSPNPGPTPGTTAAGPQISDTTLLALMGARSRTEMLAPSELPTRWIELSQFDAAIISLADLARMAKSHAEQLAALRDWLSTGPVLIVYGAGSDYADLPQL